MFGVFDVFWQVDFLVSWLFGGWPFLLVSQVYNANNIFLFSKMDLLTEIGRVNKPSAAEQKKDSSRH